VTDTAVQTATREIVVEELFPYTPEALWRMLTTPAMIGRWLMEPTGFAPTPGTRFTFHTTPAGAWDGTIYCEVLEAVPNERLSFAWRGGDDANQGYGSRLDTIVTWALTKVTGGTRLRLVHSGFDLPRNETAYTRMSAGWIGVVDKIGDLAGNGN
jgi:uncharacterized protein YndB with AHSA1/START domain